MPRQYPQQFRKRANRMVEEITPEYETKFAVMRKIALKLGISLKATRRWKSQAGIDFDKRTGVSSKENEEMKCLRRENSELRRANDILKGAFFAAGLDCPTTK